MTREEVVKCLNLNPGQEFCVFEQLGIFPVGDDKAISKSSVQRYADANGIAVNWSC